MDPMDILGGLLGGGKSSSGSLGGKILTDLLGGGRSKKSPPAQPRSRSPGGSGSGSASSPRRGDLQTQAKELEDLLGVAREGGTGPQAPQPAPQARYQPPNFDDVGRRYNRPSAPPQRESRPPELRPQQPPSSYPREQPLDSSGEVIILIRAMINAAKADGRISDDEQQAILARVADREPSTIQFLRQEFASPLDVREFAWSVPLGLEEKVYMLSLAAIDLDTNPEATYLRDLAHGLRLTPQECNAIHAQLGAPSLG